ncbi:unnamed protein product, partial [Chrysoparadoxa australica]
MWGGGIRALMEMARGMELLHSEVGGGKGRWTRPQVAVMLPEGPTGGEGGRLAEEETEVADLKRILLKEGVPVVTCRADLRQALLRSGCVSESATPLFVRDLLKARADAAGGIKTLSKDNPTARPDALILLRYVLSDIRKTGAYNQLAGVPLVPLADGSHGRLELRAVVNAADLAHLRSMGFSEGMCVKALVQCGSVDRAVEWLFSDGSDGGSPAAD